jgi:hypothetical protein
MTVQYVHLDHESYKAMEKAMREFKETTHTSTGGFYHKSIRFPVGPGLMMEFHGPLVGGYGHGEGKSDVA